MALGFVRSEFGLDSVTSEPKPCPEIVGAGEESRVRRRVDDHANRWIVTQREQLFSARVPCVPAAERGRRLVGEHDKVLGVVEDGLGRVLLLARRAGTRVRDQTPRGWQLPQFNQGILRIDLISLNDLQ